MLRLEMLDRQRFVATRSSRWPKGGTHLIKVQRFESAGSCQRLYSVERIPILACRRMKILFVVTNTVVGRRDRIASGILMSSCSRMIVPVSWDGDRDDFRSRHARAISRCVGARDDVRRSKKASAPQPKAAATLIKMLFRFAGTVGLVQERVA